MFGPRPVMSPHIGANGQPRRLSVNTIGLSSSLTSGATSQSATSPFGSMGLGFTRARAESLSSSTHSGSVDESPFEDDTPAPSATSVPATPFGPRRVSFGAGKALGGSGGGNAGANGDNGGGGGGGGNAPTSAGRPGSSPGNGNLPFALRRKSWADPGTDGYDFAERLRARAERSSVSAASYNPPHHRSRSSAASASAAAAAAAATAAAAAPPQPVAVPKARKVPDAFQERILKGDFYLD
jgi:hypothetical protein